MSSERDTRRRRILLVDTNARALFALRAALSRSDIQMDFDIQHASSFEAAKSALLTDPPAVLIADVRLGSFNGLHLLMLGQRLHPPPFGIITSDFPDAILDSEAQRIGAVYLVRPFPVAELWAAISGGLAASAHSNPSVPERRLKQRRQAPISGFNPERRVADRRARV